MIAGEALYHAYFDKEKQYLLISAMHCEQSVLGIIGDMAIKVDVAKVSIAYTDIDSGYQVSIRSADRSILQMKWQKSSAMELEAVVAI